MTRVARRDPKAIYQLHTLQSIDALAPGLHWAEFFRALGVTEPGEFNVASPAFVAAVGRAGRDAPLAAWRAYLRQQLLDHAAPVLPAAYRSARFDYRGRAIRGLERDVPRSEHVITVLTGPFGSEPLAEGLGQLYVARAFSPRAKARALQMIEDIRAAMRERIRALDWMSEPTKQRALHKLDAMTPKIGYPDRWKTYDGLAIAPDDFAGNWLRARQWGFSERLADLGRPVDRTRWFASPHLVNAFAGGLNDIIFPAAILQPPFFDEAADDAVNYGAIGSVIGHEITHHFDDRRQFDSVGNLADWWTEQDAAAYRARTAKLAQQYAGSQPLPGQAINGLQTLGENISDLGGVKIAYDGLMLALVAAPLRRSTAGRRRSASSCPTRRSGGPSSAPNRCSTNCAPGSMRRTDTACSGRSRTFRRSRRPLRVRRTRRWCARQPSRSRSGEPQGIGRPSFSRNQPRAMR